MKPWICLWVCLFGASFALEAQSFEMIVPDTVPVGQGFSIAFRMKNVGLAQWETPQFEGLKLVGGPSTSSRMSLINGQRESEQTYTYWYEVTQGEGGYHLPAFRAKGADGQDYVCEAREIYAKEGYAPSNAPSNPMQDFGFNENWMQPLRPNDMQDFFQGFPNFEMPDMDFGMLRKQLEDLQKQLGEENFAPFTPFKEEAKPDKKKPKVYKL